MPTGLTPTGLTPTGLTKGAGWEIGVSRTVAVPASVVWDHVVSEAGVHRWLGPGAALPRAVGEAYETADGSTGELRSLRPYDRVRLTLHPPGRATHTTVQVTVRGNEQRATLRFHQERLADAAERESQRAHWSAVLDQLCRDLLPDDDDRG